MTTSARFSSEMSDVWRGNGVVKLALNSVQLYVTNLYSLLRIIEEM